MALQKLWDDSDETRFYNSIGRSSSSSANTNNSGTDLISFFKKRLSSIENALGTTGAAVASLFNDARQQEKTESTVSSGKEKLNKIAQNYGFKSYNDALNNSTYDDNSAMWDELRAQAESNSAATKKNADEYKDYTKNNYVSNKINQDRGKFAGSAINTLSTAFDVMAPAAGAVANTAQGAAEGLADELEQNGLQGFDSDRAINNALIGAAAGAAAGKLNTGINKRIANNGQLLKSTNVLGRGENTINQLANKTLGKSQLLTGMAQGAQRGAVSGIAGGAAGGAAASALQGADIGTGIQNTLAGAGQGALQGAIAGGTIGGANVAANKFMPGAMNKLNNAQGYQDWKNSGNDFNERLTNTLNSGDSRVGNWINGQQSKTLGTLGNIGNRVDAINEGVDTTTAEYRATPKMDGEGEILYAGSSYKIEKDPLTDEYYATGKANSDVNIQLTPGFGTAQEAVNAVKSRVDANDSAKLRRLIDQSTSQSDKAEYSQRLERLQNQSPTTLGEWTKKAANRALDDINNKGVGLSIKDTSNNPETEVFNKLSGKENTAKEQDLTKLAKAQSLRENAAKNLLNQVGTVSKRAANADNMIENAGKLADYGLTKPEEWQVASNLITGRNGKLSKLHTKIMANAGQIDTSKGLGDTTMDETIAKLVSDHGMAGTNDEQAIIKEVQGALAILPSRKEGTITGTDDAADVMDVVRNLETKARNYKGDDSGNYATTTPYKEQKAKVLDAVADILEERIYEKVPDVSSAMTKDVTDELKAAFPNNEKWAKYIDDEIATIKTGKGLRSAQKMYVQTNDYLEQARRNFGTYGQRVGDTFGNILSKSLKQVPLVGEFASEIANTSPANRFYANLNSARADIAEGTTPTVMTSKKANTGTTTQETTVPNTDTNPTNSVYNSLIGTTTMPWIGRAMVGENVGENTMNDIKSERASEYKATQPTLEEFMMERNGVYPEYTTSAYDSLNSTSGTGNEQLDRLSRAMEMALADGNVDAFNELYDVYKQAAAVWGATEEESSSSDKLSATQQRANAAMDALNQLASLDPDLGYTLSDIPIVGNIATLGGNTYDSAATNLMQQIAYMQSGANVKDEEIALINKSYIPQPWDSEATRKAKLARAKSLIQQYQNGYMTSSDTTNTTNTTNTY